MQRFFKRVSEILFVLAAKAQKLSEKPDLNTLLKRGQVLLTFQKISGEKTTRLVTKCMPLIPEFQQPKGKGQVSPDCLTFYSITDEGWRSCKVDNILKFQRA